MAAGQEEYYLSLATGRYYTESGEPVGQWLGCGAGKIGLDGEVLGPDLRNLFQGISPDGVTALVQRPHQMAHQPGWDLTFSAPKSVSVLWSQSEPATQAAIEEAQFAAVHVAAQYLENTASFTRRGRNGQKRERTGLIVAAFEHSTSRLLDPQIHTHALVLNVGTRADGTTGTVLSNPMYRHKMAAGALYRVELAMQLHQRLGVSIEPSGKCFEIEGVPVPLMARFSQRRQQILAALEAAGYVSPKAAARVTLETRTGKEHVPRTRLFEEWRKIGREFGWSPGALLAKGQVLDQSAKTDRLERQIAELVREITWSESVFTEREIVQQAAVLAQGQGLTAEQVLSTVKSHLSEAEGMVPLGALNDDRFFTTQAVMDVERQLFATVEASRGMKGHTARESTVFSILSRIAVERIQRGERVLNPEQRAAVEYLTRTEGGIKIVDGLAGTGKTTMLAAARRIWEKEGYRVVGAALSGKAAENLKDGSGIKAATVSRWLWDMDRTIWDDLKHHVTQLGRAALKLRTWKLESDGLDGKTVLVLDEAGMVDTRQMERLLAAAAKAGATVVAIGDERQLQPIGAGGPFAAMRKALGGVRLAEIVRQGDEWARQAVADLAEGKVREALSAFSEHGQLTVEKSGEEALKALFSAWKKDGLARPKDNLILTGTNEAAARLNALAQREHVGLRLFRRSITVVSDPDENEHRTCQTYYSGDRILFLQNSEMYGVCNGDLGTIVGFGANRLHPTVKVRLDRGGTRTINTEYYKHFQLGYAVTSHKAQGSTVENVYVLAGGAMQDREITYVQASRARGRAFLFAYDTAGDGTLAAVAAEMERSRRKTLAHEVRERVETEQSEGSEVEQTPTMRSRSDEGHEVDAPAQAPTLETTRLQQKPQRGRGR